MIEKAPKYDKENKKNIQLRLKLQLTGELKKIQDDYLYWDKVKSTLFNRRRYRIKLAFVC